MLTSLVIAGIGYGIYKYIIYPAFYSPLAAIPAAHFTASWSPLWILWVRYSSIEVQTIHKAHVKHGPIVRLGPNEISVNCVDGGIRTIYAGGFEKWSFYDQFENYGVPNMFSTKESKPHSIRKRMMTNVYSKTYVQSSKEAYLNTRSILFDRLLPVLDASAADESPIDVYELNYATTMDFATSYIFGLSNDSNFIQDVEMRKKYLSWHFKRDEHGFWFQELPRFARLVQGIGIRLVPQWVDAANNEIEAWLLRMCKRAQQATDTPDGYTGMEKVTRPVVYRQLSEAFKKSAAKSEEEEKAAKEVASEEIHIASELLDHVVAGMDTSAITLTYLLWEVSRNPRQQKALRNEMRQLSPSLTVGKSPNMPGARCIDACPILHAVVMETLRRHTAIPGSQPRITPSTSTSLAGSPPLPPGVRVSAQAYSLHRNEGAFPDAERWNPERWFWADEKKKDEMMRWFWAFGSGGRMCIGSNFAMQELKYVTAAIYSNFETSIVDDTGMEQVDSYTAGPVEDQLQLKFTRLKDPYHGEDA
ncbi:MAG: hypothetical protein Q9170_007737 [Blastenia crenularia]